MKFKCRVKLRSKAAVKLVTMIPELWPVATYVGLVKTTSTLITKRVTAAVETTWPSNLNRLVDVVLAMHRARVIKQETSSLCPAFHLFISFSVGQLETMDHMYPIIFWTPKCVSRPVSHSVCPSVEVTISRRTRNLSQTLDVFST